MGMAARMGDPTVHGGVIVMGFPLVLIGGMPAARIADMHVCPMVTGIVPHVGGPILMGSPMVLIGGMPAARMGDLVTCVGPPDTIIMGCPTVLIGEGGSGSGSGGGASSSGAASAKTGAKNALTDNVEASTKEKHWIEFEFVDKAGNPVSGIPYKLKDPDGKESQSLLKPDGRILRDATGEGKGEVLLFKVQNAKWSKEIAKIGEKVKLTAESEGFDNGTVAVIQVYRKDLNEPDTVVKTLEEKVNGNKIEVELENNFESQENNSSVKKYSSACYYFEVIIGQCKARSGLLFNEDFIELELKDTDGNAKGNEEFILFLPNGIIENGKLDGNGYKKIEKIPAGRYSVMFPNLNKNLKK